MRFFKANSYEIVRLYINQIGIAIFSLVLYTASDLIKFDDPGIPVPLKVGISLFTLAFYFMLIYTVTWECGAKDSIKLSSGKGKTNKLRGFFMGLLANVPNFVLSFLSVFFISIVMMGGEGAFVSYGIVNLILRMHESQYLGLVQGFTQGLSGNVDYLIESILFLLLPLASCLVCHIGYVFGTKEKGLFSFLRSTNKGRD